MGLLHTLRMFIIYFFKFWIHPSHMCLRAHLQGLLVGGVVLSGYSKGDVFHLFIYLFLCLFIYLIYTAGSSTSPWACSHQLKPQIEAEC